MPIKSVKMKNLKNKQKNKKILMSQGSLDPKIRFLCQKVCSVARVQTDRQTRKWIQRTPFQGFRNFSVNLSSRIGPIHTVHKLMCDICIYLRSSLVLEAVPSTRWTFCRGCKFIKWSWLTVWAGCAPGYQNKHPNQFYFRENKSFV